MVASRKEFLEASKVLNAGGWRLVCSAMGGGNGLRYGSLYMNNEGLSFYLNKDTLVAPEMMLEVARAMALCVFKRWQSLR